jgi:glycosyltransferase involved in cell wall biosynthesis
LEKRKIKHIYWFAYFNLESPSVRYRGKYPLDYAKKMMGISSYFIIPGYSFYRIKSFAKAYFEALLFPKKHSIIVVQRVHSNFIYSNLLLLLVCLRKSISVYDLDDADYLQYNAKRIFQFVSKCGFISAGSRRIEEVLQKYNMRTFHVTSPVVNYNLTKKERNSLFTIGWIGGFHWGHKESLNKLLFPALRNLEFPIRLVMLGVNEDDKIEIEQYFESFKNIILDIPGEINWLDERNVQKKILHFDVGIATLENTEIQLSKSGFKAKQYLSLGIPVLCNNLPENNNVVVDGFNGFICDNSKQFEEKIIEIRNMENEEYNRLSKNALSTISNFDHNKYFDDLSELIQKKIAIHNNE